MFLAHPDQTVVGRDHEQTIVRAAAQHSKDCSPQIALVAGQVGERDHLGRFLSNLLPRQSPSLAAADNLTMGIKPHNFHPDGTRPSAFNLVLVTKEVDSGFSTTIVKIPLNKHSQESTLSSVNVPHDNNSGLDHFLDSPRRLANQDLTTSVLDPRILAASLLRPTHIVR